MAATSISLALALTSKHPGEAGLHGALVEWMTPAYVFAGAAAWWPRPESRSGVLMVAAGFVNLSSSVSSANGASPFTIGIASAVSAGSARRHGAAMGEEV